VLIDPISAFLIANGAAAGSCAFVIYKARKEDSARLENRKAKQRQIST